ncbi:DEAD/DEAH box helicase [Cohnella terricola]|uniref:Helicase SNF n=1 Tax=Cohnella terricola TaxID=1289167 RepID=A0A559JTP4_9BACL|nr:DEAD/DEAH box helicase [Cohnella terricola]TVY03254.1 helicase SNF [Cohnella terricola]
MDVQLTKRMIKQICGSYSYDRGDTDYRAGKVKFTVCDDDRFEYKAAVKGSNAHFRVEISANEDASIAARCECLDLNLSTKSCRHVAAVLLNIHDMREEQHSPALSAPRHSAVPTTGGQPSASEAALASEVLGLFVSRPSRPSRTSSLFDARETLGVEFLVSPFPYGNRQYLFGIEMKVVSKRAYAVQRLREFLERVDRRESYPLAKSFSYEPESHSFHEANDAVIRKLIEIHQHEKMYREASNAYSAYGSRTGGDSFLPVPPTFWESLVPLLEAAPNVKLEYDGSLFEGIRLSDEPFPLTFDFDRDLPYKPSNSAGYRLVIQGMDRLTVMEPYGIVLSGDRLHKLKPDPCRRLAELSRLLDNSRTGEIRITQAQLAPFLERVIPGLMKLGSVRISEAISERVVYMPLKARLYLDRVRDRLLAGLEFQYGDIVVNPLEGIGNGRGSDRILMRDGDKEAQILDWMEQAGFAKTESGYFMEDEEGQYDFLYHIIPHLEKLLQVYATTAVKARLHVGLPPAKIRVDASEKTDWLECKFDMPGVPESEIRDLIQALSDKRKYYKLPSGALLPLETPDYEAINRFIATMKVDKGELHGSELRMPAVRGLTLMDSGHQDPAIKLGKQLRAMLENMRNPDSLDFPVPEALAPILRDYQKYGYQWLRTLALYRFGGILADDMGLGKTVQSIAYLVSMLPEIRSQQLPAIIVCPSSLMYNWLNELKKFAPEIRAIVANGDKTERTRVLRSLDDMDVLITSYPLLRRDIESFGAPVFHTLFLDEAQAIKNYATRTAQAVKAVQARHKFALTGTPVENGIEELWSICDAVFPELFGDRKAFGELSRETVAKRIRPFLLRRLKTDVLAELPEKIESVQATELLPEQKKMYTAYLAKLRKEALKHLDEEGFGKSRIRILAGLTRLRQICCHPALFAEGYEGGSAKFDQLLELVEECRSAGKRVLIFSQFTEMLGMIGRELGYQGVPFFYLDGQTPAAERVELCNRFNDGERDVFLISLKAGGTGLNLTGADTVILYDLWWNPAVEQQAADRAHRIGQTNVVQVLRLVAQGTVEEKIYALQQRKKNLIEEVVQPGQEALSAITEQEIRELLML